MHLQHTKEILKVVKTMRGREIYLIVKIWLVKSRKILFFIHNYKILKTFDINEQSRRENELLKTSTQAAHSEKVLEEKMESFEKQKINDLKVSQ